ETSEYSNITNALLAQNAIFNFATEYYYKNDLKDPESFEFTDADFNNFKSFLKTSNFDYKTATEQELEELLAIASKEGYEQDILGHYKSISTEIEAQKKKELDEKKHEIVSILTDEIIKRYFYKEGLYEYYVENNPEILEAKSILNDSQRYSEILR
ncbi:MAG: peptidase S41, partial [Salegentibacter mishustinae]|nr:peptidase S41 [Salegentibacter mishustinae]